MMQFYNPIDSPFVPYVYPEIVKLLESGPSSVDWDSRHVILNSFRVECKNWLENGTKTKIQNLNNFNYCYMLYGGTQYITDMPKFEKRTVEIHKDEYSAYQKTLELYNMPHVVFNDFDDMGRDSNNLVIVSYPFSYAGDHDDKIIDLLERSCAKIVLDSVFIGTNRFPIELDFSKLHNIETFIFSYSKGFGLRYNRIGIMFTNKFVEEYDIYHSYAYHNLHGAQIARQVMKLCGLDYFTDKYGYLQDKACELLGLRASGCIHIGLDPIAIIPDPMPSYYNPKRRITHLFDSFLPR